MQVVLGHRGNSRGGRVQQGNEDQCPTGRATCVLDRRNGEEAHDDVRQTGGTDHQRHRVDEHVQCRTCRRRRVLAEAKLGHHGVETGQQGDIRTGHRRTQAQLRDRVAGQVQRDEHGRNDVGADQHDVLGDLGVGDALHAAEHGVQEDDQLADVDAGVGRHVQEAREGHADTRHLTDDVGQRSGQQADHGHGGSRLRVEAVTDELRHRELAELPEVRCKQHGEEHIAAGPAHEEQTAAVAHVGDQAGHGDERSGRHPVRCRSHAVQHRRNGTTRGVELAGATGTRPDGDADVQRERSADDQIGCCLKIHMVAPYSS